MIRNSTQRSLRVALPRHLRGVDDVRLGNGRSSLLGQLTAILKHRH